MGSALDEDELAARDRLVGAPAADLERDLPSASPAGPTWGRDLREVVAEVRAAEGGDAVERSLGGGEGRDVARVEALGLGDQVLLVARSEKAGGELVEERDAVALDAGLEARDVLVAEAAVRVVVGLQEVGRNRCGEYGLGDAVAAVGPM